MGIFNKHSRNRDVMHVNGEKLTSHDGGYTYQGSQGGKMYTDLSGEKHYYAPGAVTGGGDGILTAGVIGSVFLVAISVFLVGPKCLLALIPLVAGILMLVYLMCRTGAALGLSGAIYLFVKFASEMTRTSGGSDLAALNAFTVLGVIAISIFLLFCLFRDYVGLWAMYFIGYLILIASGFVGDPPGIFTLSVWIIFAAATVIELIVHLIQQEKAKNT